MMDDRWSHISDKTEEPICQSIIVCKKMYINS